MPIPNIQNKSPPLPQPERRAKSRLFTLHPNDSHKLPHPHKLLSSSVPEILSSSQLNLFSAGCGTCTRSSPSSRLRLPHGSSMDIFRLSIVFSSRSCVLVPSVLSSEDIGSVFTPPGAEPEAEPEAIGDMIFVPPLLLPYKSSDSCSVNWLPRELLVPPFVPALDSVASVSS